MLFPNVGPAQITVDSALLLWKKIAALIGHCRAVSGTIKEVKSLLN